MIISYLCDMINDQKTPRNLEVHLSNEVFDYENQYGEWKIQLTMPTDFISSKDSDETHNMHTKSNNVEIMMGSETDDIIEEFFESLFQKSHEGLKESTKGIKFIFDSADLLYHHLQKSSLKRIGSP